MQKKAQNRQAAPPPRTAASQDVRPSLRQIRAARSPLATRRGPQCDGPSRRNHPPRGPVRRSARSARIAPPFGLSLPAMIGKRHHLSPRGIRGAVLISSLLALLAFAVFPVGAFADSAGSQYEDSIPSPYGGNKKAPKHEAPAKTSSANSNGGASAPSSSSGSDGPGSSGSGSSATANPSSGSNKSVAATGGNGGSGQGSQGNGQGKGNNAQPATPKTPSQQASPGKQQPADDGGGSSPLIPILVAVAALAAISLGIVYYRQRRQRSGQQVSPKAS